MSEQNFERIAQLIAQLDAKMEGKFEQIDARFEAMDAKFDIFKSEIVSEFNHSLDIKLEELFHRIGLLRDGVADVADRVEGVNQRVDLLNTKVEGNSLQLLAHHLNPHAHSGPGGDRVKEQETVFGDPDPFHQFDPEFRKRLLEAKKSLDEKADEVLGYCAEKGIELPTDNTEAMIRLIQDSRRDRAEQELKQR